MDFTSACDFVMPLGKHKGERITALPLDYIKWVLENMQDLREPLQSALTGELRRRETSDPPAPAHRPTTTAPVGRPAGGQAVESPPTNGNGAAAEAKVRKIVRQEFAAMLKRVVAALEKE